jgi:hypothetical protein
MRSSRSRRRFPLAALVVVVALLVPVAATALQRGPFPDVPDDHPFVDEISWMSATGITQGFGDGTFKPGQAVTRQSMSAFMQRLYDLQEDLSWSTRTSPFSTFDSVEWTDIPGASVRVDIPDAVYGQVVARFSAESQCLGDSGAWCSIRLVVSEDGGPFTEMFPASGTDYAFDHADVVNTWESHMVERVGFGDPGASYQVKVQGRRVDGATSLRIDDWTLIAETDLQPSDYIPF